MKLSYLCLTIMINTRTKIIESAITVFSDDLSAPLQKVADNASVTRRTLHRYFKDRNELVSVCGQVIERSCKKAMLEAIESSDEPLAQLEGMVYAAVDCGTKYSIFNRLHQGEDHQHTHQNKNCKDYDIIYRRFQNIIEKLQKQGRVSSQMSTEWIQVLLSGIVESTLGARSQTGKSIDEIKNMAWISYMKAISA